MIWQPAIFHQSHLSHNQTTIPYHSLTLGYFSYALHEPQSFSPRDNMETRVRAHGQSLRTRSLFSPHTFSISI